MMQEETRVPGGVQVGGGTIPSHMYNNCPSRGSNSSCSGDNHYAINNWIFKQRAIARQYQYDISKISVPQGNYEVTFRTSGKVTSDGITIFTVRLKYKHGQHFVQFKSNLFEFFW